MEEEGREGKGRDMSKQQQFIAGFTGFALIAAYSWIMTAAEGTIASWAWMILAAAIVLLVSTARSVNAGNAEHRGD